MAASFSKFLAILLLVGMAAGCSQIEPSPTVREDGTLQYCPNPFNRHHVLMAARRHCAPLPAQPLGFETCQDDPLVDGWVFACRYNPGYDRLEIDDARTKGTKQAEEAEEADDPDGDGAKAVEPAE